MSEAVSPSIFGIVQSDNDKEDSILGFERVRTYPLHLHNVLVLELFELFAVNGLLKYSIAAS